MLNVVLILIGSCFNWGVVVGFGAAAGAINMQVALPAYLGNIDLNNIKVDN